MKIIVDNQETISSAMYMSVNASKNIYTLVTTLYVKKFLKSKLKNLTAHTTIKFPTHWWSLLLSLFKNNYAA